MTVLEYSLEDLMEQIRLERIAKQQQQQQSKPKVCQIHPKSKSKKWKVEKWKAENGNLISFVVVLI